MSRIIILNGPAGVGKTTVSKCLVSQFENAAVVEGDVLKNFIISKNDDQVEGRLGYKNGAHIVSNFIEAKYEMVVFEYVFPTQDHVEYFLQNLRVQVPIYLFTLWAPLEVIQKREGKRERESLGIQVQECYNGLAENLGQFDGDIIQTDSITPDQVAQLILDEIAENPLGNARIANST